jgi:hypothetical protein
MDLVQQDATEDVPDSRYRVEHLERLGARGGWAALTRCHARARRRWSSYPIKARSTAMLFWTAGSGKPLRDARAVGFVGQFFPEVGSRVWAMGRRDVSQQLRPLPRERPAASEQVAGGAHGRRIDRGLREQPAAPQHSDVLGIDPVVCGLPAVDRFHI